VKAKDSEAQTATLGEKEARKFLNTLAAEPFVCVVITDDGGIQIFSKDISAERLAQAKESLNEAMGGE
jgi:hypothetical protein